MTEQRVAQKLVGGANVSFAGRNYGGVWLIPIHGLKKNKK
jgi:hypothetical protein